MGVSLLRGWGDKPHHDIVDASLSALPAEDRLVERLGSEARKLSRRATLLPERRALPSPSFARCNTCAPSLRPTPSAGWAACCTSSPIPALLLRTRWSTRATSRRTIAPVASRSLLNRRPRL